MRGLGLSLNQLLGTGNGSRAHGNNSSRQQSRHYNLEAVETEFKKNYTKDANYVDQATRQLDSFSEEATKKRKGRVPNGLKIYITPYVPYSTPEFEDEWQTIIQAAEENLKDCLVNQLIKLKKKNKLPCLSTFKN